MDLNASRQEKSHIHAADVIEAIVATSERWHFCGPGAHMLFFAGCNHLISISRTARVIQGYERAEDHRGTEQSYYGTDDRDKGQVTS